MGERGREGGVSIHEFCVDTANDHAAAITKRESGSRRVLNFIRVFRKTYILFSFFSPGRAALFQFSRPLSASVARTAVKTGNEPRSPCSVSRYRSRVGPRSSDDNEFMATARNILWLLSNFPKIPPYIRGLDFCQRYKAPRLFSACVLLVNRCAFDVHVDRYRREGNRILARLAIINLRNRLHVDSDRYRIHDETISRGRVIIWQMIKVVIQLMARNRGHDVCWHWYDINTIASTMYRHTCSIKRKVERVKVKWTTILTRSLRRDEDCSFWSLNFLICRFVVLGIFSFSYFNSRLILLSILLKRKKFVERRIFCTALIQCLYDAFLLLKYS